jgi:hypothetical protein
MLLSDRTFHLAVTGTLIRAALLIAALSLRPETSYAAPQYSASIPGVESVNASPTPVFLSNRTERVDRDAANNVIGQATHQETAGASYGQLRGTNNADYLNVHPHFPIFSGGGTGGQQFSSFALDDFIITGPPGNIMISFNFTITGSLGTSIVATGNLAHYAASAEVEALMSYQSSTGGAGNIQIGQMGVYRGEIVSQSGIFQSFPLDGESIGMGTTPSLPTFAGDTALMFGLALSTRTSASVGFGGEPGHANGYASFGHTFGFPTSGPVANLPEGYTLNSISGNIVDNQFVPPEPADFDEDGDVDGDDLAQWQGDFGENDLSDADDDGDSDGADFLAWQQQLGSGAAMTAAQTVPEPASAFLAAATFAAAVLLASRPQSRTNRAINSARLDTP